MNDEFIILYCDRDKVWLVARRTWQQHRFKTVAECFTEESAEILYEGLMKK